MTRTYIFQAALYCERCASDIMLRLKREREDDRLRSTQIRAESDCVPCGPYADGGGEADTPQHCDACNEFLENPLTSDGVGYTLQRILGAYDAADDSKHARDSYSEHVAKCLDHDGEHVLATWARFYDLPDAPESESE